jgi:hypothetical protein
MLGKRPHRSREPDDLIDRLTLCAQREKEAADLCRRRLAGHDLAHRRGGLRLGEVLTANQAGERLGPGELAHGAAG